MSLFKALVVVSAIAASASAAQPAQAGILAKTAFVVLGGACAMSQSCAKGLHNAKQKFEAKAVPALTQLCANNLTCAAAAANVASRQPAASGRPMLPPAQSGVNPAYSANNLAAGIAAGY